MRFAILTLSILLSGCGISYTANQDPMIPNEDTHPTPEIAPQYDEYQQAAFELVDKNGDNDVTPHEIGSRVSVLLRLILTRTFDPLYDVDNNDKLTARDTSILLSLSKDFTPEQSQDLKFFLSVDRDQNGTPSVGEVERLTSRILALQFSSGLDLDSDRRVDDFDLQIAARNARQVLTIDEVARVLFFSEVLDANHDGIVSNTEAGDALDAFRSSIFAIIGDANYELALDVRRDGRIDAFDVQAAAIIFNQYGASPM